MRRSNFILLGLAMMESSCIERFIPERTNYEKVLFIECRITDDTACKPTIYISSMAPVVTETGGKLTFKPEGLSGASVTILCNDGTSYVCTDTKTGAYDVPPDFTPSCGKSYQLSVNYEDNLYKSEFQRLNKAPKIDSITWRHVIGQDETDNETYEGYRFFVSTHIDTTDQPNFFRWIVDATFKFNAPLLAEYTVTARGIEPISNRDIRTCWKDKPIWGIFLANTQGLTENRILEKPLNFESQQGDELSIRYSLNVKQLSISESAYLFWKKVNRLEKETGGLYPSQPGRLDGNIYCINDPGLYVIGIFEVAGVSSKRIFLDQPEDFPVFIRDCDYLIRDGSLAQIGDYLHYNSITHAFEVAPRSCFDCRLSGGYLLKPPFWEDD